MKNIKVTLEMNYTIGDDVSDWNIEHPRRKNGKKIRTITNLEDAKAIAYAELDGGYTSAMELNAEFDNPQTEIEKAKKVLKDAGYFTDNLWSVNDVIDGYTNSDGSKVSGATAYKVVGDTLENPAVIESINEYISIHAEEQGLNTKNN